VTVIDLTHQIAPFDVRAGSHALTRSVPHLGHGIVLAVVDPGVGSGRRGVCLQVEPSFAGGGAPQFFVGPDNGLLIAAAELLGGGSIWRGVELEQQAAGGSAANTFDGRDVFAPAAAALCRGVPLEELGSLIDPATLVRLPTPTIERGRLADGRHTLRTEITWVDHFGNLQLAARLADATRSDAAGGGEETGALFPGSLTVELLPPTAASGRGSDTPRPLRYVETFADLAPAELGLLEDSNGHLAVVANQTSAAQALNVPAGGLVLLTW
jgi:S-adenosylmethionine hydrolase